MQGKGHHKTAAVVAVRGGGVGMTVREALKIVTECGLNIEEPAHEEAMVQIKSALEKQIPKKPILSDEQAIRYAMQYTCPSCGKNFSGTGIADYCYHCGQALDWEEDSGNDRH